MSNIASDIQGFFAISFALITDARILKVSGGGAYDAETGFLKTGGGFRCLQDVLQGSLSVSINSDDPSPCLAGEGIRWDAADVASLLPLFQFKCTGATDEALKTVVTDDNTFVMIADFYR